MRALITGANRGIGRAIAVRLAEISSAQILVSRSGGPLAEVAREVSDINPECATFLHQCDLSKAVEVEALIQRILESHESLDLLINCAGQAIPATSVQEITPRIWDNIFDVNVRAPFLLVRGLIPLLRKSNSGAIVNVASTAGTSPRPGWSAYAASKAALVNFSHTMSEELKPDEIAVHCVAPGRTATELRQLLAPDEDPASIMQPESVAEIVRFLVGPEGRFLQGQTVTVRGD